MQLEGITRPARRVWATNANTSSFASKIPTITEPTNDGILNLTPDSAPGTAYGDGISAQFAKVWPIGLGANNDAFSLRILGWQRIGAGAPGSILWYPTIIAEVTCIMGNVTGVAGSPVPATEFFCDTIVLVAARQALVWGTISTADANWGRIEILSPANDTPGYLIIPLYGYEKIELTFDQTTNTPTMNALVSLL
jgi:hypothetical protein